MKKKQLKLCTNEKGPAETAGPCRKIGIIDEKERL